MKPGTVLGVAGGSLLIQGTIRDLGVSAAGQHCAWSMTVYWGSQRLQKEQCRLHNCKYCGFRKQGEPCTGKPAVSTQDLHMEMDSDPSEKRKVGVTDILEKSEKASEKLHIRD